MNFMVSITLDLGERLLWLLLLGPRSLGLAVVDVGQPEGPVSVGAY